MRFYRNPLVPLIYVGAALVVPGIVKKCKPLSKIIGNTLVSAGDAFLKVAAQPDAPSKGSEPTVAEVTSAEAPAEATVAHAAPPTIVEEKMVSEEEPTEFVPPMEFEEPKAE